MKEGETSMHYAAGLSKKLAHDEFEDTDIIKLLLEYNGDINTHTKMVIIAFPHGHKQYIETLTHIPLPKS